MSNYNKSFNFRNGVQVDEDDLVVRSSLVGIGTTIPRSELDVRGNIDVTGLVTSTNLYISGIATFTDVKIGAGITIYGNSGIISATFYGDGSNLRGIPTSQWIDINPGTGVTSIYSLGNVGIATTGPTNTLQIGGKVENGDSGVGISSSGNIYASGIVTASSFVGGGSGLTALNASQITSGSLPNARLPQNLSISGIATIATLQAAQINNTGIATISDLKLGQTNISGVATVGFATVSAAYVNNLTVGVATITTLNATSNISATSITGLQKLVVTGIATVGLVSASDVYVTGVTTTGTIIATTGTITNLTVGNSSTLGNATATNVNVTGIVTSASIQSTQINNTGIATLSAASITGLNAGVTTSTKIRSGAVRIGYGLTNEIDTFDTDLLLDSAGGTVIIDDNLSVTGVATITGALELQSTLSPTADLSADLGTSLKYFQRAYVGEVNIGIAASNEIATRSNTLILDSAAGVVQVDDNLIVTGYTYLTGITTVQDSILPDTDQDAALGSASLRFSDAYIDNVRIGVGSDNEVSTGSGNLKLDSSSKLVEVADRFKVTGESYLTGISTVETGLLPNSDKGSYLGSSSKAFSEAYIDEVRIGVGGTNVVDTREGNLVLNSSSTLVEVADRFKVTGQTYLVGISTVETGLLPDDDKGAYLGSSSKSFGEAYIDEVRIGVGGTNVVDTREGNLVLDSQTNNVVVNNDLTVNQITNLSGDLYVGTNDLYVDQSNNRIGIGTSSPSNDIEVLRNSNLNVEFVAESGYSRIAIGQSLGIGNSSATIEYSSKNLNISNKDTGNLSLYLHSGAAGINTGRFEWVYGQTNNKLMSLTYDGKLGIGIANPEKNLHVVGTSTVTGNAWFGGDVTISGSLNASIVLPTIIDGSNINATSGISTFNDASISVLSVGSSIGIGSTQPSVGLDVQSDVALIQSIGVNTNSTYSGAVLSTYGNVIIDGALGITTNYVDPGAGSLQIYSPLTEAYTSINLKEMGTVGFNTGDPKAVFDFSNVGSATTRPVMVVPNINNSTINGIGQTPTGSVIFNTTTSKFQGYTGSGWVDFH